jgi:hypothetical protein
MSSLKTTIIVFIAVTLSITCIALAINYFWYGVVGIPP